MKRLNYQAILLGTLLYLPISLIIWSFTLLPAGIHTLPITWVIATAFFTLSIPACGYLTARLSKKNGLLNGFICGVLLSVFSYLISAQFNTLELSGTDMYIFSQLFSESLKAGILASLGGGVGELHAHNSERK